MKLSDEIRAALEYATLLDPRPLYDIWHEYSDVVIQRGEFPMTYEYWLQNRDTKLQGRVQDLEKTLRRSLAVIDAAERLHTAVSELKHLEAEFSRTGIHPEWDGAYDEMFNANEALKKALEGSEDAK